MSQVVIESRGGVALMRLNHGVTNAIGPEMAADLAAALQRIGGTHRGAVLAGGEKFFSMGFDLPVLLALGREEMAAFLDAFDRACFRLYTLPLPTVCAIRGHAVAGGHILALTCDFRVAAEGRTKLGLTEVRLGVPVPLLADLIQRQVLGDRAATRSLFSGAILTVGEAAEAGLVDEVLDGQRVEDRALEMAAELAALPAAAFAAIKANRVEAVAEAYERRRTRRSEIFLDCWFDPQTRELLGEAARKF